MAATEIRISVTIKMNISDIISLSLVPLLALPLLLGFLFKKQIYIIIFVAAFIIIFTVEIVKVLAAKISDHDVFKRPEEAYNCTLLNGGGAASTKPGFPSGHVAVAVFITVSLLVLNPNIVLFILSLIYICLVGYSRYSKSCHNMPQIIVGGIYGVCWVGLIKFIASRYH